MTDQAIQKNLYDYLNEYERLCLELYIYREKTGDFLCEGYKGVELRNNRNQCMREILDKFNAGLK